MLKKDVIVLFDVPKIRITNLIVLECPLINGQRDVPRTYNGKTYPMTRGSCCSTWKTETFTSFFTSLSIDYGFKNRKVAWDVYDQLYQIDEWKKEMEKIYKQIVLNWF
jgi:hypothetical protein